MIKVIERNASSNLLLKNAEAVRSIQFLYRALFFLAAALVPAIHVFGVEAPSRIEFWISTAGDDGATGEKHHPFATLERARDAIRALKIKNGATVWIESGLYARRQTLVFNSEDSGTDAAPIRYRAEGGTVRFHAGHFLKPTDFEPVTDPAIQNRLASVAHNKVVQFALSRSDIKHIGPFPNVFNDNGGIVGLFCNDLRMPISRWPNEGPTTMSRVLDRGDTSRGPKTRGGKFVAREDRVANSPLISCQFYGSNQ